MRIRYSFTSDLSEVMEKVIFHLEHFKQKKNLEKQFAKVISDLSKGEINHTLVVKQINELREELSKLDLLLLETSEIVSVCQQGLAGDFEVQKEEPRQEEEPKPQASQAIRQTSEAVQAMELQNAFKNIQNITGELKKIKNKNV